MKVPAELLEWLGHDHELAPDADVSARESDVTAERLASLTRSLRPRRAEVGAAVVLHHPSGRAFAAAYAGRILVHSTLVPAALDAQGIDALPGWLSVEPDPPDITFSRGADVLRDALARAFAAAAAA